MTILEVHNLKKVYTTRFGGNQVQAAGTAKHPVLGRGRRVCRDHGRVRIGQNNTFEYSGGT